MNNMTESCKTYVFPTMFRIDTYSGLKMVLHVYLIPIQFVIGVAGNILNLLVLNSRSMANKTNFLIGALSAADLFFFLVLLPISLEPMFATSYGYLTFVTYFRPAAMTMLNWMSSVSIWIAVSLTLKRLIGVLRPLHMRVYVRKRRLYALVLTIIVVTLTWTLRFQLCFKIITPPLCSNHIPQETTWNQTYRHRLPHESETFAHAYWHGSQHVAGYLQVIIPLVVIIITDTILVFSLRRASTEMKAMSDSKTTCSGHREDMKVTKIVVVMITAFTIFNLPSCCIQLYQIALEANYTTFISQKTMQEISHVSNALVYTGKIANFFIFCSISQRYRKHLKWLTKRVQQGSTKELDPLSSMLAATVVRLRRFSSRRSANQLMTRDSPAHGPMGNGKRGPIKYQATLPRTPRRDDFETNSVTLATPLLGQNIPQDKPFKHQETALF